MTEQQPNASIQVLSTQNGVMLRLWRHNEDGGRDHMEFTIPILWSYECAQKITMAAMRCEEGRFDLP
ncbi:hypothetical protein [Streptomyces microflavus]|uniref:hypothetical protein n=1 Tax=Streptomyces microflavus TaxID=1919 RepID=UPI0036BB3B4C